MSEDYTDWAQRQRVAQERVDQFKAAVDHVHSSPSSPITLPGQDYPGGSNAAVAGCVTFGLHLPLLVSSVLLYPIPAAGAVLALSVTTQILTKAFAVHSYWAKAIVGVLVAWATLAGLIRLDHRLAKSAFWRVPRHLLRLGLLATVAFWFVARVGAANAGRLLDLQSMLSLLRNPVYLAFPAGVVLFAYWLLTRKRLREGWHQRLKALKLVSD